MLYVVYSTGISPLAV